MTERVLDIKTANLLVGIVRAAQFRSPVARSIDGKVVYATANVIVADDNGRFMDATVDVRDAFLTVVLPDHYTTAHWPIAALIEESFDGRFVCDYKGAIVSAE